MIKKLDKRWIVLVLLLSGLLWPMASALADCNVQSSSGDDDIVVCANPADTNGIITGAGNDTLMVNADTEVSSTSSRTIDTGMGDDVVTNRGTVHGRTSTIFMDQGNDTLYNYGTINAVDHAGRCFPQAGQTCTMHNYSLINTEGEALDVISTGHTVIYNTGTIISTTQEPMHIHGGTSHITNLGTLSGQRQAIEVYDGSTIIINEGTATAVEWPALQTYHSNDEITNRGYVRSDKMQAIFTAGGADIIRHYGTAEARNDLTSGAVIDGGRGNDTIIVGGDLTETGNGTAAIRGESGSDTIIIEGGTFNRLIDGDEYGSNGYTDVLIFRFTGTQAEIDAFRASMNGKSPANGTTVWRGDTYQWDGFERITLELTVSNSPTATPTTAPTSTEVPPTNTPAPTNTALPTNTPAPTNTAQPTSTSVPPTATSQPGNALGAGYYEQDHPAITYTGGWQQLSDSGASSSSFRRTNDPSAQASFQFTGTRLTLIALKFVNRGSMEICIDGTNCRTENMYAPSLIWQHPLVFDVTSGTHTVLIRNLSGAYIDVDAVRVEGDTVSPSATPTDPPTNTPIPPTATVGCPASVPAGVTAQRHDPTNGSRNLRLQFENVNGDACMGVTHYVVYAWSGSYTQQWTFNRDALTCVASSCWADITVPNALNSVYWRVEAYNALGTGGSDNSKRWTY